MKIALFDFDGTITTDDSLIKFIHFAVGDIKAIWGILLLSPMLITYKLKLIPNYKAKQWMLSYFFKGMNYQQFQKIAERYSIEQIDKIILPKAMERIRWHQQEGHKVVIVSASMESWLKKWCQKHNIDLISTRLEIQNGKLTGKFATKNCYGIEKVNRIKERYNLSEYSVIYAYGDSLGDTEMLSIATEQYYKHFN
ncbi:MAG: haloacid dehalogenase-like hydrolase [Bacteroidetes bacterium]|nr:haloacid dehalogenase-like hydrolase [Bacteroidota bacterium]